MSFVRESGSIYSAFQRGARLRADWYQYDTNVGENRSDFEVQLRLENVQSDFSSSLPTPYRLTIDGEEFSGEILDWSGAYVNIATIDKVIEHEPDGTRSVDISAWFDVQMLDIRPFTLSGTAVLQSLNDIPTVTQRVFDIRDTSVRVIWESDKAITAVRYSIDGGVHWEYAGNPNGAKSGTYDITGLEPETSYSVVTHVESIVDSATKSAESLPKEITTYPVHYFKTSLSLRSGTRTTATVLLNVVTVEEDFYKYYPERWVIYPSGYENDKIVIDDEFGVGKYNATIQRTFKGLLPEHDYYIRNTLYEQLPMEPANEFQTATLHIRTMDLGGDLVSTLRTASIISMEMKNIPTLDYDTRAVLSYKKSSDSEWTTKRTYETIANGETKFTDMFTGLKSNTSYDFKVSLYKVGSPVMLIKEYIQTVSTIEYTPEEEYPYPYFIKKIVVPSIGRGVIVCGVSEPLKEGCSVVLFGITNLVTDEREEVADMINRGDEYFLVSGRAQTSSVLYFRVGIKDPNGNIHNISEERLEVYFPPLFYWDDSMDVYTQGAPVNLYADAVRELEGVLCNAYDYTIYDDTHDTPDIKEYYDVLKTTASRINQGDLIKGGFKTVIHQAELMASAFLQDEPMNVPNTGEPITAHYLNVLGRHLCRVLDILDT